MPVPKGKLGIVHKDDSMFNVVADTEDDSPKAPVKVITDFNLAPDAPDELMSLGE
jgi:hypothetical protein